ncbi:hypothetical protein TNCV_3274861 [Trichonephila clavipes]|uniref:Uncharacterized protein n=1 Tax=Trichonephila clavipes TaxID=2585209 RepID=A0A8X6SHZ2_TRICX|nr:hypothetical protein TNCV_3274861 [Trichonephila clavipes]
MSLRHFRKQYEQFESERIIGMMEAGWSARRVARQLGRSDCVVRRHLLHWPPSKTQVASSLGDLCLLKPYEGVWLKDIWILASITCAALDAHPSTPPFGVVPRTGKLYCSGMEPGCL